MGLTSVSLSSGFIWACGSPCIQHSDSWGTDYQIVLVFAAALTAWWGYLIAHYTVDKTFINRSGHVDSADHIETDSIKNHDLQHQSNIRRLGTITGVTILIIGMMLGVIFIRQGNHLLTNIGGILFLTGYVIAHYAETGKPV